MQTESCCDIIQIEEEGIASKSFSGRPASLPINVISQTSSVTIRFTTDNSLQYTRGFRLIYKEHGTGQTLPCGAETIVGTSPVPLNSPNYPNNYPNSLSCTWSFFAAAGQQLLINITDMEMEQCCDKLEIRDGQNGRIIATLKYSSINEPLLYTSTTGRLYITMTSDTSVPK
uniref:CUB domain-containing protein n=1 Tax=Ciona intestinalis TaxID=7719 RepID=H2XSK7_CIOIN